MKVHLQKSPFEEQPHCQSQLQEYQTGQMRYPTPILCDCLHAGYLQFSRGRLCTNITKVHQTWCLRMQQMVPKRQKLDAKLDKDVIKLMTNAPCDNFKQNKKCHTDFRTYADEVFCL